eukprot:TRINITY_DN35562_c0_g2_i2.p1 TRINITY_DN35562_c0_g2~~TRINITY_DN35562_c0_g2_i2.p1  ORF type:complete len:1399 (-),score=125.67 TRINITY_DN35562_c0_g2_i2:200-4396(-)
MAGVQYMLFMGTISVAAGGRHWYSTFDAILAINTDMPMHACVKTSADTYDDWGKSCDDLKKWDLTRLTQVHVGQNGFLLKSKTAALAIPQTGLTSSVTESFAGRAIFQSNGVWLGIDWETRSALCAGFCWPNCSSISLAGVVNVFPTYYGPHFVAVTESGGGFCFDVLPVPEAARTEKVAAWQEKSTETERPLKPDGSGIRLLAEIGEEPGLQEADASEGNTSECSTPLMATCENINSGCRGLNFTGITDVFSAGHASFAFNREAGTGFCWGHALCGGSCSGIDFTGVTDVFSNAGAFVALKRSSGAAVCWGSPSSGGDCSGLSFQGVTDVLRTREAFFAFKRYEGVGFCWGQSTTGGSCSNLTFTGVTDVFATGGAFLALNRNAGTGFCWGDGMFGGDCSTVDFSGVTDVVSTNFAFLAFRRRSGEHTCWGYMSCLNSLEFMACPKGHMELETGECVACLPGTFYSATSGVCETCAPGTVTNVSAATACFSCRPGRYARGQSCAACPAGRYLPEHGAASVEECLPCPPDTYSSEPAEIDERACRLCPGLAGVAVTNQEASSKLSDCVCAVGYFLPDFAADTSGCVECDGEALSCRGNGTAATARERYYLHEVVSTGAVFVPCVVDGGEVCLGGISIDEAGNVVPCSGNYSRCPDQCYTGHRGYACASCDIGYTRKRYPDECECCEEYSAGLVAIFAGYVSTSLQALVLASMQATAARQASGSIHTIMIRTLTSWCLTVGLLGRIDLTQLQIFEWSEKEAASSRGKAGRTTFAFPEVAATFLTSIWEFAYGLPDMMQLVNLEETLTCVAHDHSLDPQVVLTMYWSFVHVPVHLVIAVMVSCIAYWTMSLLHADSSSGSSGSSNEEAVKADQDARKDLASSSTSSLLLVDDMILGLFQSGSSLPQVLLQMGPVLFFMMYCLWPQVTQSNLFRSACGRFPGRDGFEERLLSNLDKLCWTKEHWDIMIFSYLGVALWTGCPIAYLYLRIRAFGLRRQSQDVQYRFGYFYSGLKVKFWWWDILVKRSDICIFLLISTHPSIPDDRARLLWFTFASAVFWAIQERYKPFDGRQGGVLNALESLALSSRFSSVLFISSVLLLTAGPWQCIALGIVIFFANAVFLAFCFLHILIDAACANKAKLMKSYQKAFAVEEEMPELSVVPGAALEPQEDGKRPPPSPPPPLPWKARAKRCAIALAIWICSLFASFKEHEMLRVPTLIWRKVGGGVSVKVNARASVREGKRSRCAELLIWNPVRWFFHLTNQDQRQELLASFADLTDYVATCAQVMNGDECCIPTSHDVFVVLALAHKEITSRHRLCTADELRSSSLAIIEDLRRNERGAIEFFSADLAALSGVLWTLPQDELGGPLQMILDLQDALWCRSESQPSKLQEACSENDEIASL